MEPINMKQQMNQQQQQAQPQNLQQQVQPQNLHHQEQQNAAHVLQNLNEDLVEDQIEIADLFMRAEEEYANRERWDNVKDHLLSRTEALTHYYTELMKMTESDCFSPDQIRRRADVILSVWDPVNVDNQYLNDREKLLKEGYQAALQQVIAVRDAQQKDDEDPYSVKRIYKQKTGMSIPFKDKEEVGFPEDKVQALHEADQWLLDNYASSKNGSIENSMILSFFSRHKTNRLLAYYMIENGYRTDITKATVVHIKNTYTPNVENLKKAGLKLEKTLFSRTSFKEVYQSANQTAPFLMALYKVEVPGTQAQPEEQPEEQQDEVVVLDIHQQKIQDVYDAIGTVNHAYEEYKNCSFFNPVKKRNWKNELQTALKNMGESVNALLDTEIKLPGEIVTTVEDYVKEKLQKGKLVGSGGKSSAAVLAASLKMDGMLSASAMTNYVGGAIGGLTGIFGAVLAVGATIDLFKNFSKLTWGARFSSMLDVSNQAISSVYGMGASVTGPLHTYYKVASDTTNKAVTVLGGETAAVATAGVGIVVGAISAGVAAHQYDRAVKEGKKGKEVRAKFTALRMGVVNDQENIQQEIQENPSELDKKIHYENNILKIQERIVARNKITAGCQMISGVLVMGASIASLFSEVPGMALVSAGLGAAGFLLGVGGSIVSKIKKKQDYKKAVDDFLALDMLAEKQFERYSVQKGTQPSKSEKNKIREQLRTEIMEAYGFTSVKAFCAHIMNTYAKHIHQQMEPVFRKLKQGPEANLTEEERAYLDLVKSLGLKVEPSKKTSKKSLPTQQMIFSKLMR